MFKSPEGGGRGKGGVAERCEGVVGGRGIACGGERGGGGGRGGGLALAGRNWRKSVRLVLQHFYFFLGVMSD